MALNLPEYKSLYQRFMENQKQQAATDLQRAQAQREQAKANLPFGGQQLPGAAGQVQGLEMMKGLYGEDSPQYKQALNAFNLGQQGVQSRVNYQNVLTNTANKRFSTPLAKTVQEQDDIHNGYMPGTKTPLTDEQRQIYQDLYGLDLQKKTSDQDTRKKNLFSRNIDITLSQIDPSALTAYSGLEGTGQLLQDKADDAAGNPNPRYLAYQKALTNSKLLAKQVRQFYGDSITPSVQEGLKQLTNPNSWLKSPQTAMANFKAFVDTLQQEKGTYTEALKSTRAFGGPSGSQPPPQQPQQQQQPPQESGQQQQPKMTPDGKVVLFKDGVEYHMPPEIAQKALASGEGFTSGQ